MAGRIREWVLPARLFEENRIEENRIEGSGIVCKNLKVFLGKYEKMAEIHAESDNNLITDQTCHRYN